MITPAPYRTMLIPLALSILFTVVRNVAASNSTSTHKCRSQPGDPSFPTAGQFAQLNSSVEGRLLNVIPSAQFCKDIGGCPDAEWADSIFRSNIPGAMLQANWEQDYASDPPSLCFRNTTVCGQGSVPIYAINATSAAHIQAGVRFAQTHNLKVAIKASGHDLLGRSTAKNSLLLWTRYFEDISFHDSFRVEGKSMGSAVTVGSGVGLHAVYQATKAQGKIFVGGTAANVVPAGGYVQGAGHSALGPLYGLAADNALEFQIVIASGDLVTANEKSNPDLFWALRGGGAGSWGVVISVTLRTFPTFDIVHHEAIITVNSSAAVVQLATLHAQHIFDWDDLHASQFFYATASPPTYTWFTETYFPNSSIAAASSSMAPFLDAAAALGFNNSTVFAGLSNANDLLSPNASDSGGTNGVIGSRLVPADVYRYNATAVGEAYQKLFGMDSPVILVIGSLVGGGQVSKNAHIDSAINPKWRTAKIIISASWGDSESAENVEAIRQDLTQNKVPVLEALAGPGSGSYSNEADVREPHFQTTFFGSNYARLSAIKEAYDPRGLFVVGAGVGSEKWDADGLCRVE